jgi:hypothetical protein
VRIQPIPEQTGKEQKNWISCWSPVIVNIYSFKFNINAMLFFLFYISLLIPECIYLSNPVLGEQEWFHGNWVLMVPSRHPLVIFHVNFS